jgi:hypothetical protein
MGLKNNFNKTDFNSRLSSLFKVWISKEIHSLLNAPSTELLGFEDVRIKEENISDDPSLKTFLY